MRRPRLTRFQGEDDASSPSDALCFVDDNVGGARINTDVRRSRLCGALREHTTSKTRLGLKCPASDSRDVRDGLIKWRFCVLRLGPCSISKIVGYAGSKSGKTVSRSTRFCATP